MRVEQRIGRLDRIGQSQVVQVFNFWVKGTIEERVLNVLERRINIFEETIGGLDPILGDAERDLRKIFSLGGQERERALQKFEEQIEKKIVRAREAEEKLRDFIMETKSYSKEIALTLAGQVSPVTPADQELFVCRLLADVNTHLARRADGAYDIAFHEPFLSDYPRHSAEVHRRRTVAMRADVKPDSEHVEYLALGHPIVDDLIGRVTSLAYPGSTAAFEVEWSGDPCDDRSGWLAVYELGVPALKEVRELAAIFVDDSGGADVELGHRLMLRLGSFPNDHALTPADVPTETLDPALSTAEAVGFARLGQLEGEAAAESAKRLERERIKFASYFDYRDEVARDRLASSQQVLANLEASDDAETRKIIPVWKANVARDERLVEGLDAERLRQPARLDQRASGCGDLQLRAVARVEIVSGGVD
jgi:hypothetical protein